MLLGAAAAGGFAPLWSARILEEWARATRRLPEGAEAVARAEIARMRAAWPEAEVAVDPDAGGAAVAAGPGRPARAGGGDRRRRGGAADAEPGGLSDPDAGAARDDPARAGRVPDRARRRRARPGAGRRGGAGAGRAARGPAASRCGRCCSAPGCRGSARRSPPASWRARRPHRRSRETPDDRAIRRLHPRPQRRRDARG